MNKMMFLSLAVLSATAGQAAPSFRAAAPAEEETAAPREEGQIATADVKKPTDDRPQGCGCGKSKKEAK